MTDHVAEARIDCLGLVARCQRPGVHRGVTEPFAVGQPIVTELERLDLAQVGCAQVQSDA